MYEVSKFVSTQVANSNMIQGVLTSGAVCMGSMVSNLNNYDWLFDLFDRAFVPIMSGGLIILVIRSVGACYRLSLADLPTFINQIKWALLGLLALTFLRPVLQAIVELISTMPY